MKPQDQYKCVRCGSVYSVDDQEREAYSAPGDFEEAGHDHCLACWLGVGPLDLDDSEPRERQKEDQMNNDHEIEREQIAGMIERDEDHETVGDRIEAARDKRVLDDADCKRLHALNHERARIGRMIERGESRDEIRSRIVTAQGHDLIGDEEANRLWFKTCSSRDEELALVEAIFESGRAYERMFAHEANDDADDGQPTDGGRRPSPF